MGRPRLQRPPQDAFIVAVNCGQAAATCFCVSMGTGPRAESVSTWRSPSCSTAAGTASSSRWAASAGAEAARRAPVATGRAGDEQAAERSSARAASQMGRTLDTTDIRDLLYRNREHPRWDEVADRCLTCGNCTMVCPTCFCSSVDDVTDLAGEEATRGRRWDSCFSLEHSYVNGGSVRSSTKARYRQWMTHKLASWIDQFGTSGCVGCGRCITWCPVAIDITEEAAAIPSHGRGGSMRTIDALLAETPACEGCDRAARADRRLRAEPGVRRRRAPDARGRAGGGLLRDPQRATWRSRPSFPSAGRSRSRRCTTATWSAGPGSCRRTGPCSTRARWAHARVVLRRRVPARQVRGRPRARLRAAHLASRP